MPRTAWALEAFGAAEARPIQIRDQRETVNDKMSTYQRMLEEDLAASPSKWRVALNRLLDLADEQARRTDKGAAAHGVFDVRCGEIGVCWRTRLS